MSMLGSLRRGVGRLTTKKAQKLFIVEICNAFLVPSPPPVSLEFIGGDQSRGIEKETLLANKGKQAKKILTWGQQKFFSEKYFGQKNNKWRRFFWQGAFCRGRKTSSSGKNDPFYHFQEKNVSRTIFLCIYFLKLMKKRDF